MKRKILKSLKVAGISIVVLIVIALFFPTWTPKIKGVNSISVLQKVKINGAYHEVMIRGYDKKNPVIIFVHGGPGCSEIPYVTKYQDLLERNFTVVQYDQRGSGKSHHFFVDYSKLTTDLLADDLLSLTDYVANRLGQKKVLLIGHSFGTYIGMTAAYKAPDKYEAYIGIGQMSFLKESEMESLNFCIKQAEKKGIQKDVAYLKGLEDKVRTGQILVPRDYVRKYGGAARLINDNADYMNGFLYQREYNLLDYIRFILGVKDSQDALIKQSQKKPLPQIINSLKLPCYFVMGKYDYMTAVNPAKEFFNEIQADKKEFIIFNRSAHYPQFEEKEKFNQWMCDTFLQSKF